MANIETLLADTRYFVDQGSDPSAPSAGNRVLYTKAGGLYLRSSSAILGPILDETAHDLLDHTGLTGVGAPAFIGCQALKNANQGTIGSSETAVTWTGTDIRDTDAMHDPSSNSHLFTIPASKGGLYFISAWVTWDNNSSGQRSLYLRKNPTGTNIYIGAESRPAGAVYPYQQITTVAEFAAGDTVGLYASQSAGSNRTIEGGTQATTFTIYRIAA